MVTSAAAPLGIFAEILKGSDVTGTKIVAY